MSDNNPDRPRGAVLYCERLLGLQSDCNIPYCPERESSTGWLIYDAGARSWYVGFRCPNHGHSGAWRPEWQQLIDQAIGIKTREGFDVPAALRALRDGRKLSSPPREVRERDEISLLEPPTESSVP